MIKILVVEDERPISDLIRMNLEDAGYQCTCALDGLTAADILEKHTFDLVLLDIMLPKVDGYELFEYIKPTGTPVIFLTAKAGLNDRVKGLNLGAEDYIVKPFEIVELMARIQVVLRRYHKDATKLVFGDIVLNTENRTVCRNGQEIVLTPKEFTLLELLVRNKNMTLFRDKIYELVWENDSYGDTRTLDLHVQRLRKKLGLTEKLKTIYKVGYRLED
ncbi:response regulator transcription factor [Eubacterium sp. MSJ-33]|uniref:response regulator transcription factor n=1 Tax=Eubacterium sp. MSJ-33 TaxID=2841528 RepID=UPI001C774F6F|nr:response regulator transcription factor [Eubacterium sp. MSJ-33]QWT54029.1 response regulator transcription factor [Eubacterium sp. MSJ-33]